MLNSIEVFVNDFLNSWADGINTINITNRLVNYQSNNNLLGSKFSITFDVDKSFSNTNSLTLKNDEVSITFIIDEGSSIKISSGGFSFEYKQNNDKPSDIEKNVCLLLDTLEDFID